MEVKNGQDFIVYLQKTINNNEVSNTYKTSEDSLRGSGYWKEYHNKCYKADRTLGIDFWDVVENIYNNCDN